MNKYVTDAQIIFEPEKFVASCGDYIITDFKDYGYFRKDGSILYKSSLNIIADDGAGKTIVNSIDFKKIFYMMLSSNKNDINHEDLARKIYQKTKKSIIVGGCGRSGTTLLLSILSCHPLIEIFEETFYFYPPPMRLNELAKIINGSPIWCEKTPKNVLVFNEIKEVLKEKCKFIHMVRDGRDVVTSIHPTDKEKYWVPIERWVEDVTKGLQFKDAKIVKYEDLVGKTEETIKDLLSYLEINFDKKLLSHEIYGLKSSNAWASSVQKINKKSLNKWKDPKHKIIIDRFMNNKDAVLLLKRLGYEI